MRARIFYTPLKKFVRYAFLFLLEDMGLQFMGIVRIKLLQISVYSNQCQILDQSRFPRELRPGIRVDLLEVLCGLFA